MATGSAIGMMDGAFFVSKSAILDWLNSTYKLHLTKIEETASGAVACQVLDSIFPGEVNMSKVRWDAKSAHEYVGNYKVLQQVLQKKGVDKYIDVERLMRGKYQDNLENMQWFKAFYERNASSAAAAAAAAGLPPYDPIGRRSKGRGADLMPAFTTLAGGAVDRDGGGSGAAGDATSSRDGAAAAEDAPKSARGGAGAAGAAAASGPAGRDGTIATTGAGTGTSARGGLTGPAASTAGGRHAAVAGAARPAPSHSAAGGAGGAGAGGSAQAQLAAARRDIAERDAEISELRAACASLERERDFYFGKLREIEILAQVYGGPDKPFVDSLCAIMYATEEDFVALPEGGGAGAEGQAQPAGAAKADVGGGDAGTGPAPQGHAGNDSL